MSELKAKRVRDRISALPDAVLCHILSFLPTGDSVMTCFLSRRWKKLWVSVPSLDFSDELEPGSVSFLRFVDNVLFFRDSSDIRKFRLFSCGVKDFARISGWIGAAIRRNVVELDLSVTDDLDSEDDADEPPVFELPECVFTSKTLTVLELSSNFIINTPPSGCFPSLKSLNVQIDHPVKSVEKLFSCCPVLEKLRISGTHGMVDPILNFVVSVPELKTLAIHWWSHNVYQNCCNFYINAPKLRNFRLSQHCSTECFLENAKSLVNVIINLYDEDHSADADRRFSIRGTALLAGISSVRNLYLSAHLLKGCVLPLFDKLIRLELNLYYCYYWELLKELLMRSPNLEHLILKLREFDCGELSDHKWSPPESVPTCLSLKIKTISIRNFKGKQEEMEAAKYLLRKGGFLKKMNICYNDSLCTKGELHKEFSMFHLGSKTCQVEILPDRCVSGYYDL